MNIIRKTAIDLAYVFLPSLYKRRFYKKLHGLTFENVKSRNVEFEFLLLSQFLKEGSIFFDVGVNKGSYLYQANKIISEKNIYGFEPHPVLFKKIKHLFPKIHAFNLALSDVQGMLKFKVPYVGKCEFTGRGTLNINYKEVDETSCRIFDVQTDTLDNFIRNHKISRLDFLKIDVEGSELNVIRGGRNSLEKFRPILLVEVEERHHNDKIWNIIQPILELDYEPFYLDRNTVKLKQFTQETPFYQDISDMTNKEEYLNNFIFLPKNSGQKWE
jgi:FkbM family methyltransferase